MRFVLQCFFHGSGHSGRIQAPAALDKNLGEVLETWPPDLSLDLGDPATLSQRHPDRPLEYIHRLRANGCCIAFHPAPDRRDYPIGDEDIHLDFHGVDVILQNPVEPQKGLIQELAPNQQAATEGDHLSVSLENKVRISQRERENKERDLYP